MYWTGISSCCVYSGRKAIVSYRVSLPFLQQFIQCDIQILQCIQFLYITTSSYQSYVCIFYLLFFRMLIHMTKTLQCINGTREIAFKWASVEVDPYVVNY